jgi:hypothetical protein
MAPEIRSHFVGADSTSILDSIGKKKLSRADTKEANTMHLISLVNSITKNMNLVIC